MIKRGYSYMVMSPKDLWWLILLLQSSYDKWTVEEYKQGLQHPSSERQFQADLDALNWADTCLLVLPCGRSAIPLNYFLKHGS